MVKQLILAVVLVSLMAVPADAGVKSGLKKVVHAPVVVLKKVGHGVQAVGEAALEVFALLLCGGACQ